MMCVEYMVAFLLPALLRTLLSALCCALCHERPVLCAGGRTSWLRLSTSC